MDLYCVPVGPGLDPGIGGGGGERPTGAREETPGTTEGLQPEDRDDPPAAAAAAAAGNSRDAGAVQGEALRNRSMYTGTHLQRVRSQGTLDYNEQIFLHASH